MMDDRVLFLRDVTYRRGRSIYFWQLGMKSVEVKGKNAQRENGSKEGRKERNKKGKKESITFN